MTNESAHLSPGEGDDAETAGITSKLSSSVLTPAPEMSSFHPFIPGSSSNYEVITPLCSGT
jgi:hypothetical protein